MDNKIYNEKIKAFCEHFENSLKLIDERDGTKTGFVFLFVRKDQSDCIDIGTNLTNDTVLAALEHTIELIKNSNNDE